MRLTGATFESATARLPHYDRARIKTGIAHIGPGAFARAHLASFTDDILDEDPRWGIAAIALNSATVVTRMAAQDGLYTLAERHADGLKPRIIGAFLRAVDASRDPDRLCATLMDPDIAVITLTITEKAYAGRTPELLAQALDARAKSGAPPVTVLSLDNLPGNGNVLRNAVLDRSQATGQICEIASFPCSMVDRITPAMQPDLVTEIESLTGLRDDIPVVTEPFRQWVVEDDFRGPRPTWDKAGVEFVDDVVPFEEMKLRLLNGAHSTMAYLGQLRGHRTVFEAMGDAEFVAELDATATDEVMPTLHLPPDIVEPYWQSLKQRFAAPGMEHRLAQIANDGSQKIPIRIMAPLAERRANGGDSRGLTRSVAGWIVWVGRAVRSGDAPCDPRWDAVRGLSGGSAGDRVTALCDIPNLVPLSLARDMDWRAGLASAISELERS